MKSSFQFFVLCYYLSLRSEFCVVMSVTISSYNRCSVRLYLQLFVGRSMSYLHYLCLFAHSDVQPILCCDFVLFFFVSCTICCQFLWIVLFLIALRYSRTFINPTESPQFTSSFVGFVFFILLPFWQCFANRCLSFVLYLLPLYLLLGAVCFPVQIFCFPGLPNFLVHLDGCSPTKRSQFRMHFKYY